MGNLRKLMCVLRLSLVFVLLLSYCVYGQTAPATNAQSQQAAAPASSSQLIHILAGHSVVLRTEARLKRVVIGDPNVVTTVTTSPNELVVTAKAAGVSSVVLLEETGETRLLEVFADVDIAPLREAIQTSFAGEHVQVEAQEGKVLLTGVVSNPATAEQMAKMAAPFSKDVINSLQVALPGRQKQVLLKVRFAEVDRSKLTAFGINILSTGSANTIGTTTTGQFGAVGLGDQNRLTGVIGAGNKGTTTELSVSDLLNIFVFRPDLNLGAVVRDLQNRNVLQILAEPNLMALSGEPAKFLAGGEFPYAVVTNTGGLNTVTVQFKPFGVKLDFTGTIENENMIRLKVSPEVSTLDFANGVTISGFSLPALSTRRAETLVELKDGQSFGIAGLLDQRTTAQLSKVPGIGDVPVLGNLFKSRSMNKSATELLVLVTPTIVDPVAAPTAAPATPTMPITPLNREDFDKGVSHPPGQGTR